MLSRAVRLTVPCCDFGRGETRGSVAPSGFLFASVAAGSDSSEVLARTSLRAVSGSTPVARATVCATPSLPSHRSVLTGPGEMPEPWFSIEGTRPPRPSAGSS